jgi:hypothetical protein
MAELPRERAWQLTDQAIATGRHDVDAPAELRLLTEQLWSLPGWLDPARAERGGAPLVRAGVLSGMVLGLRSIVLGYAAPGGNKPLVFSGQLERQAPRRLRETTRFVQAVSLPGGMARGQDGFVITARVRLMHAQVRRMIRASGRWDDAAWGAPINQHDMLATLLLFSVVLLDGLDRLGLVVPAHEAQDMIHLWRYVGHVIGVDPALGPHDLDVARAQQAFIEATQAPPDDDARRLTRALLTPPPEVTPSPKRAAFIHGLFRHLNGDLLADQLAVPPSPIWTRRLRAARPVVRALDGIRARLTLVDLVARQLGDLYWQPIVTRMTAADAPSFRPPAALLGLRTPRAE